MNKETVQTGLVLSDTELHSFLKAKISRAIIHQEIKSLRALGFNQHEMQALCQLDAGGFDALMRHAGQFFKTFIHVDIDHVKLAQLIAALNEKAQEQTRIQKLIQYQASKAMMTSLFGLSVEKFSYWRCYYGLQSKGRAPIPSDLDKRRIWSTWHQHLELNLVDRLIAIYEHTGVPLRSVWAEIQSWQNTSEGCSRINAQLDFIETEKCAMQGL